MKSLVLVVCSLVASSQGELPPGCPDDCSSAEICYDGAMCDAETGRFRVEQCMQAHPCKTCWPDSPCVDAACPTECLPAAVCFSGEGCDNATGSFTLDFHEPCLETLPCADLCWPESPCRPTFGLSAAVDPEGCAACGPSVQACYNASACDSRTGLFTDEALCLSDAMMQVLGICAQCFPESPCAVSMFEDARANCPDPACAAAAPCYRVGMLCDEASGDFLLARCSQGVGCAGCWPDSPCSAGRAGNQASNTAHGTQQYDAGAPGCTLYQQEAGCGTAESCFDAQGGACNAESGMMEFESGFEACLPAVACLPCYPESACGGVRGSVEDGLEEVEWKCPSMSSWDVSLTPLMLLFLCWEVGGSDPMTQTVLALFRDLGWDVFADAILSSGSLATAGRLLEVKFLTYLSGAAKAEGELAAERFATNLLKDRYVAGFDDWTKQSFEWAATALEAMRALRITGRHLVMVYKDDLTLFSFLTEKLLLPDMRASIAIVRLKNFLLLIDPGLPPSLDVCSAYYGQQTEVYAEIAVDELQNIDESSYVFEAKFSILLSWLDDRQRWLPIYSSSDEVCNHPCTQTGLLRCCTQMWSPSVSASNSIQWRSVRSGGAEQLEWPASTVGTGRHFNEIEAAISANGLDFREFPYDVQDLNVTLVVNSPKEPTSAVRLVPSFASSALLRREDEHSALATSPDVLYARGSWSVVGARIFPNRTRSGQRAMLREAYRNAKLGTPVASFAALVSDISAAETEESAASAAQSAFTLTVTVLRDGNFYILNIVVPIVIIEFLAWFTFFLPPVGPSPYAKNLVWPRSLCLASCLTPPRRVSDRPRWRTASCWC